MLSMRRVVAITLMRPSASHEMVVHPGVDVWNTHLQAGQNGSFPWVDDCSGTRSLQTVQFISNWYSAYNNGFTSPAIVGGDYNYFVGEQGYAMLTAIRGLTNSETYCYSNPQSCVAPRERVESTRCFRSCGACADARRARLAQKRNPAKTPPMVSSSV
jgi:hypothetical protein